MCILQADIEILVLVLPTGGNDGRKCVSFYVFIPHTASFTCRFKGKVNFGTKWAKHKIPDCFQTGFPKYGLF